MVAHDAEMGEWGPRLPNVRRFLPRVAFFIPFWTIVLILLPKELLICYKTENPLRFGTLEKPAKIWLQDSQFCDPAHKRNHDYELFVTKSPKFTQRKHYTRKCDKLLTHEFRTINKDPLFYLCVVVLASYTLVGPTFLLKYITRLLWQPHKLLLSNYNPYLGSCKWQPPWSPFASALVTDWYQYSGCCATHAHGMTL